MNKIKFSIFSALLLSTLVSATTITPMYDGESVKKTKEIYMFSQMGPGLKAEILLLVSKDKKNDSFFSGKKPEWNGSVFVTAKLNTCLNNEHILAIEDKGYAIKSITGDLVISSYRVAVQELKDMGAKYIIFGWAKEEDVAKTFSQYIEQRLTYNKAGTNVNSDSQIRIKKIRSAQCDKDNSFKMSDLASFGGAIAGIVLSVKGANSGNTDMTSLGGSTTAATISTADLSKQGIPENTKNDSSPIATELVVRVSGVVSPEFQHKNNSKLILAVPIEEAEEVLSHYMEIPYSIKKRSL